MLLTPLEKQKYWPLILLVSSALLFVFAFVSMSLGPMRMDITSLLASVSGKADDSLRTVFFEIRLPRTMLAIFLGATLSVCGAMTQGLFRNPLADPSLIGVSGGASLGASVVIVSLSAYIPSLSWFGTLSLVSVGAFFGALVVVMLVYRISTSINGTSVSTMLLAGIAVTFLAGSVSSLFEYFADNEKLRQLSMWRMGGLESADPAKSIVAFFVAAIVLFSTLPLIKALNIFLLGESEARHLGINTQAVKLAIILIVAFGVSSSVALVGPIAFVGLVVPHFVRIIIGPHHRYLIPLSALVGALLLLLSDILAKNILSPSEIPVGIITSLIGAPVFILMLKHRYRYGM